jgi:hypothetical protein
VRSHQDGEADASIDSLGDASLGAASLGAEVSTGASDGLPVDVPLLDGEHAIRAAPIATMNKSFLSMYASWVLMTHRASPLGPTLGTGRP